MDKLLTYLESAKPLLNIKELERAAGIPDTMLNQILKGNKPMPDRYYPAILFALIQKTGAIQLDGWVIRCDEIGNFLLHKDISLEGSNESIHIVTQDRRLYDQSEIKDFLTTSNSN